MQRAVRAGGMSKQWVWLTILGNQRPVAAAVKLVRGRGHARRRLDAKAEAVEMPRRHVKDNDRLVRIKTSTAMAADSSACSNPGPGIRVPRGLEGVGSSRISM